MKRLYKLTVWLLTLALITTFIPSFAQTIPTYNVTVTDDGNGTASASPASGAEGTEVTLTVTPNEGYQFKEWQVTPDTVTVENNKFTIGTENVEIKAVFEEDSATFAVTVATDPVEGGTVTGSGTYAINASATVTAAANEGYVFDGWYENDIYVSGDENYTFTVDEDRALTAGFSKKHTITFNINNGTADTDSESVADGREFTLPGDIFTNGACEINSWNTEADGSGYDYSVNKKITVTEDIVLYAQWVLPLNKLDSFSTADYEWSGDTVSSQTFTMKNGVILYASVIFPSVTDGKTVITVNGDCEIKGKVAFEEGTAQAGSNSSADLTITGNGTLKFREMDATGAGDRLTVETDVTIENGVNIGASGGMNSTVVIKDATLTLHNSLSLLQYLSTEGEAKLNIIDGTASFHGSPEITLSDKSEIYIGGNGADAVLYKESEAQNEAFDTLIRDNWLPEGFSFKKENYGYYLYNPENTLAKDAITIKKQGYTVIFKDWNGSDIDKQTVSHGASATAPQNPTREGWTFVGWDTAFDNVTGHLVVNAQYVKKPDTGTPSGRSSTPTYTIKFDTNGGTAVANKFVKRNYKLTAPEAPEKDGFTFGGWYADEALSTAYNFDTNVTKSFTLYAKWNEIPTEDDNAHGASGHDCPSLKFSDLDITQWYHFDTDYVIEKDIFRGTTESTFAPDGNTTRAMMITVLYRAEGEPEVTDKTTFKDIDENAYYAKAVVWGQQNGIIKGYSETEYVPEQNILREQIAAIMHRYAQYKGYDVSVGENTNILSYDDFDSISEYAIPAMQWAVGSGMIKGRTESTLNPDAFATRVEIAAMLHRFIEANL